MVIRRVLLALAAVASLTAAPVSALEKTYPPTPGLETCAALDACLALIGAMQPPMQQGYWPREVDADVPLLAARFGPAAKQALIEKMVGPHGGWRNYAAAAISIWPELGPEDVPPLARALELKPGGWAARGLARIGGPAAIEALVAHPYDMSQTSFALAKLAPESLPYMLPLLAQEENGQGPSMARTVIRESEGKAVAVAPAWVALALNRAEPVPRRLAALRGLAAIGDRARDQGVALRPLRDDAEAAVREEVAVTLAALRDSSVSREIARTCRPVGELLTGYAHHIPCLYDLAAQYRDREVIGPALMAFLDSPDGAEAASAATILGFIAWEPARPKLEALLASRDWRVAYAAARSLGWMGGEASLPTLDRAATTYWLPLVRTQAGEASATIRRGGRLPPPPTFEGTYETPGLRWLLGVDHRVLEEGDGCPSASRWHGQLIRWGRRARTLEAQGGSFVGSDDGEWGGALAWRPARGGPVVLLDQNVVAMVEGERGPVVAFGLGHLMATYGFVAEVTPDGRGGWTVTEIARLPGAPSDLGVVSPGVYAAATPYGVIVFDRNGPLGCGSDD